MTTLVFSYSHADEAFLNELQRHLSPLKRLGKITTWHDRRIVPGQEFERQIDRYFSEADIILLLISSDFIASDYCYQIEMKNALERHDCREAVVIPVILRECAWHQLPFGKITAATIDGKPIDKFASRDDGYVQVADAVSRAIDNMEAAKPFRNVHVSYAANILPQASDTILTPRSSNLSLPKNFTDLDKDRARREGFEYVARYFENSLEELKKRYSDLDIDLHHSDANSFICAIYINGNKVGQCGIWYGASRSYGIGEGICFSQEGVNRNSYNECLTVDDNGQVLGFRPLMGINGASSSREALLTNEGMAAHLWDMFFKPIQQRSH